MGQPRPHVARGRLTAPATSRRLTRPVRPLRLARATPSALQPGALAPQNRRFATAVWAGVAVVALCWLALLVAVLRWAF
jgi:hypothetical protein